MEMIRIPAAILEDESLDAKEKMLLIVLSTSEGEDSFDSEELGRRMGAPPAVVKATLESLTDKGYLEGQTSRPPAGRVLKKGSASVKEMVLGRFDDRDQQIERVMDLIEETINYREASIILNLAGGNVDRIETLYRQSKKSQLSDPLGMLINALQKKEEPATHHPERSQASRLKT